MGKILVIKGADFSANKVGEKVEIDNGNTGGVPSGYTPINGVEFTGTQYLNTGVIPSGSIFAVEIDAAIRETSQTWLWSFTNGLSRNGVAIAGSKVLVANAGSFNRTEIPVAKDRHVYKQENLSFYIDNEKVIDTAGAIAQNVSSLLIAKENNEYCKMALYSCKVWNGDGTLVRDFVPAKNSSGTVGLYDKKSKMFYSPEGGDILEIV